jgi:hypothetical protein
MFALATILKTEASAGFFNRINEVNLSPGTVHLDQLRIFLHLERI